MRQNRREFLERVTTGAMLAAVPFSPDVLGELGALSSPRGRSAEEFDLTWVDRVKGKYRAVFDVPEIILPRPSRVFEVFFQRFDILLAFCWDTLWTTVLGFLIAIAGGVNLFSER